LWPCVYLAYTGSHKDMGLQNFGLTTLTFWGHMTSSGTWPLNSALFPVGGQWWPCVYLAWLWRYKASQILGLRLDFMGSRDVVGHVTIGFSVDTFYWWSMTTMLISCTVTKTRGLKNFGVATLTFRCHVIIGLTMHGFLSVVYWSRLSSKSNKYCSRRSAYTDRVTEWQCDASDFIIR